MIQAVSYYYHIFTAMAEDEIPDKYQHVKNWKRQYINDEFHEGNISRKITDHNTFTWCLSADILEEYRKHAVVCKREHCNDIEAHLPLMPFGIAELGGKVRVPCVTSGFLNLLCQPIRKAMWLRIKNDPRCKFRTSGANKEGFLRKFFEELEDADYVHSGDMTVSTDNFPFSFMDAVIKGLPINDYWKSLALLCTGPFRILPPNDDTAHERIHAMYENPNRHTDHQDRDVDPINIINSKFDLFGCKVGEPGEKIISEFPFGETPEDVADNIEEILEKKAYFESLPKAERPQQVIDELTQVLSRRPAEVQWDKVTLGNAGRPPTEKWYADQLKDLRENYPTLYVKMVTPQTTFVRKKEPPGTYELLLGRRVFNPLMRPRQYREVKIQRDRTQVRFASDEDLRSYALKKLLRDQRNIRRILKQADKQAQTPLERLQDKYVTGLPDHLMPRATPGLDRFLDADMDSNHTEPGVVLSSIKEVAVQWNRTTDPNPKRAGTEYPPQIWKGSVHPKNRTPMEKLQELENSQAHVFAMGLANLDGPDHAYLSKKGLQMGTSISIAMLYSYNLYCDQWASDQPGARGKSQLCGDDSMRAGNLIYIDSYKRVAEEMGSKFSAWKDITARNSRGLFTEIHFEGQEILRIPKLKTVIRPTSKEYVGDGCPEWKKYINAQKTLVGPTEDVEYYIREESRVHFSRELDDLDGILPFGLSEAFGGMGSLAKPLDGINKTVWETIKRVPVPYVAYKLSRDFARSLTPYQVNESKPHFQINPFTLATPIDDNVAQQEYATKRAAWLYLQERKLRGSVEAASAIIKPPRPVEFIKENYRPQAHKKVDRQADFPVPISVARHYSALEKITGELKFLGIPMRDTTTFSSVPDKDFPKQSSHIDLANSVVDQVLGPKGNFLPGTSIALVCGAS